MSTSAVIDQMRWGECLLPAETLPPVLRAEVRRELGMVPGWTAYLAACPWLVRACARMVSNPVAHAPQKLCDLIALVVSQDNSCRYCFGAQRAFLAVLGYPEEQISRLERDVHVTDLSPAERTALAFARKVSRGEPRAAAPDFEALRRAGFDRPTIAEIAFVATSTVFMNRMATLVSIPPESFEGATRQPLFRLLRPLLAWRIRPRRRAPAPLPEPNDGPCSQVVAALDGSPAAGLLRRTIDEAWASEILPRRAKALMLAVIGRALDCSGAQAEARRLLAPAGLGGAELDEILAHLTSPALNPLEARLVPFARETVRYSVPVIQERTRELADCVGREELLEIVGMVSLANAVCRLSVLPDCD